MVAIVFCLVSTNFAQPAKAAVVKLNKSTASVYLGGQITLKLTGTSKSVTWNSKNKAIATVSQKGIVTGKKKGKTEITAKIGKKSYTCKVTVKKMEKTNVQSKAAKYISLDNVGTYNKDIITDKILDACTLGEVDKANLPYWTGFVSERKISVNLDDYAGWSKYTPGPFYFSEDEIACLKENGFNCYRIIYSFSWLSKQGNAEQVNLSELEQLDEVISWCAKYNIHCMLSFIGLPGMKGKGWQKENVGTNNAIFTDSEMSELYGQYCEMLSKRYADLPSGLLSFQLVPEPSPKPTADGDVDMENYCDILGTIADRIWEENSKRIVIVMNCWGKVPEALAAKGCCLSDHIHLSSVEEERFKQLGLKYEATWPMPYLPKVAQPGTLKLVSKTGFEKGTYTLYIEHSNGELPKISCDGTAAKISTGTNKQGILYYQVAVPSGTKEITWEVDYFEEFYLDMIQLKQNGKETISIPTHALNNALYEGDTYPTIQINSNGTVSNLSGEKLDADYIYDAYIKKSMDIAQKYKVSYIQTEVGTDTDALSVSEYIAYHSEFLKCFKQHNIGWMFNCAHNIFAPKECMWLNGVNNKIPFKSFTAYKNTPYFLNKVVFDLLKKYK